MVKYNIKMEIFMKDNLIKEDMKEQENIHLKMEEL